MLKVELLRNERERVVEGLKKRNWTSSDISIIDQIIELDDERKVVQTTLDRIGGTKSTSKTNW